MQHSGELGRACAYAASAVDVEWARALSAVPREDATGGADDRMPSAPVPLLGAVALVKPGVEGRGPARRHPRQAERRAAEDAQRAHVKPQQVRQHGAHPDGCHG